MKIRTRNRVVNGKTYRDFVVDLGHVDGKRKTRAFKSREEADLFLQATRETRRKHGDAAIALHPAVALRYAAVEDRLAAAGATIEQAADFYLSHHRPVKEVLTLGELLDKCVLEKELQGLTGHYLSTFTCSCGSFVNPRRHLPIAEVTRDMVKSWILGNGWAPKTQRGYLGDLRALFAWAVQENFLVVNPIAVEKGSKRGVIALGKMVQKEPEVFSPEQVERLFNTALTAEEIGLDRDAKKRGQTRVYRELIGYLALATFAGVRPGELTRLPVGALDLETAHVGLDGKVSKTSDRRILELSENCVAWLRLWRAEFPKATSFCPGSWDRHLKRLRVRAGLVPWPHDVLRHSFASYFHATHENKERLQAVMGHSQDQDTLDRNYRAVRVLDGRPLTKALAAKFWAIAPPR